MLNESDLKELILNLKNAKRFSDWDIVDEAIEYMQDFVDGDSEFDDSL